jgi:proline iminopeptidase
MNPLRYGSHALNSDGLIQRYHVRGCGGPVCVAVPDGPGMAWEFMARHERRLVAS